MTTELLTVISVAEFIIILLLFFVKFKIKKAGTDQPALVDVNRAYSFAKEQNSALKEKIRITEKYNGELEAANLELMNQKEKLLNSKAVLEELHNKKQILIANLVHDIKNPAGAIKGMVELLNNYDLNAMEQQEIMTSIMEASKRLVDLSQEVCTIIVNEKHEERKFEISSLKSIIESVYTQNLAYAKSKGVRLIIKISNSLPDIKVDPDKIHDAIDNLINNAVKFAPVESDTLVEIASFFNSSNVIIQISDTGVGMSEEDIAKAFTKGGKLSAQPTNGEESSGLGLWLVKQIIEEHNGVISIKSKPGNGTTFTIELPIH
jgi:signal transduction histidine kinase